MKTSIMKASKKIFILIFWIFMWELSSLFINNNLLFPTPFGVFKSLINLSFSMYFWQSVMASIMRVIIAILFSIILGVSIGVLSGLNKIIEEILSPFIVIVKATPVMSIIIIALLWFKSGNVSIFTTILVCFPIIYTNVLEGIKTVDKDLLDMARVFKVKKIYVLKDIYIPWIKSYIVSGILMCLGLGWKVAVASEVLSTPKYSIGINLLNAKSLIETNDLFAWTIVVIILSYIFEILFKTYLFKWKKLK
ncbi:ABC transporter permease [Clostridium fallax]|uniref:NitT/TauT family transport system permease protein n=1 Tax=Clostridium fallax TaxID=1533 RepID=A0A1M4SXS7_9CLOT|nr:ABC transporter permease subunit [Clostridium fallax]SHE36959.1 NitT/TauT family transport system permease protein [Clostridium fallax]SQB08020.1 ABC transporter permease [Clostridium fallax]